MCFHVFVSFLPLSGIPGLLQLPVESRRDPLRFFENFIKIKFIAESASGADLCDGQIGMEQKCPRLFDTQLCEIMGKGAVQFPAEQIADIIPVQEKGVADLLEGQFLIQMFIQVIQDIMELSCFGGRHAVIGR